ncbi:MAG TPA: hypothetical protein VKT49_04300 [Bryobacteraceae bacterium]|nr:hypothetical protein [Bryobacteraceae bacterium]
MRAKPDLVPDCDVHGKPMYRDERPASELGLAGSRDVIVWRCCCEGCRRYFEGATGYRDARPSGVEADLTPRCPNDGAFLVAQRARDSYICPVAGCSTVHAWGAAAPHEFQLASAT